MMLMPPPRGLPRCRTHDCVLIGLCAGELGGDPALAQHQYPVGHTEDLGQLRGDHQHGETICHQPVQDAVHLSLGADVDAARRLVDDQQRRAARQPLAEHDLLLVAADRVATVFAHPRELHPQAARPYLRQLPFARAPDQAEAAQPAQRGQGNVLVDAISITRPCLAPVLGHQSDPGLHGRERLAVRQLCAVDPHLPEVRLSIPKTARATSVRPAPTSPARATISPRRTWKENVVEHADAAQFLHIQYHLTGFSGGLGNSESRSRPTMDRMMSSMVTSSIGAVADSVAVTLIRHPLTAREGLLQPVGDEQHGRALGAQCPDHVEQPLHLDGRQSGGRLVHHQNPCIERQCLGDLHDLLSATERPRAARPGPDAHRAA